MFSVYLHMIPLSHVQRSKRCAVILYHVKVALKIALARIYRIYSGLYNVKESFKFCEIHPSGIYISM